MFLTPAPDPQLPEEKKRRIISHKNQLVPMIGMEHFDTFLIANKITKDGLIFSNRKGELCHLIHVQCCMDSSIYPRDAMVVVRYPADVNDKICYREFLDSGKARVVATMKELDSLLRNECVRLDRVIVGQMLNLSTEQINELRAEEIKLETEGKVDTVNFTHCDRLNDLLNSMLVIMITYDNFMHHVVCKPHPFPPSSSLLSTSSSLRSDMVAKTLASDIIREINKADEKFGPWLKEFIFDKHQEHPCNYLHYLAGHLRKSGKIGVHEQKKELILCSLWKSNAGEIYLGYDDNVHIVCGSRREKIQFADLRTCLFRGFKPRYPRTIKPTPATKSAKGKMSH